jgi:hypothetical protein
MGEGQFRFYRGCILWSWSSGMLRWKNATDVSEEPAASIFPKDISTNRHGTTSEKQLKFKRYVRETYEVVEAILQNFTSARDGGGEWFSVINPDGQSTASRQQIVWAPAWNRNSSRPARGYLMRCPRTAD